MTCMMIMHTAPVASSGSRRLMLRDIRNQNGTKKCITTSASVMLFQVPPLSCQRRWKNVSSSRMFEYQVRKNWANAMYDQNAIHPKSSFPMSWKCSTVTALPRMPLRCRASAVTINVAMLNSAACEKSWTPKMVENQVALSDRNQSNVKKRSEEHTSEL